jgi:hypothetical protein
MGEGGQRDAVDAAANSDRHRSSYARQNGSQSRLDAPARLVFPDFRKLTLLRHRRHSYFGRSGRAHARRFASQARTYNVPTMARHVSSLSLSGSRSLGTLDHLDLQFLAFQFDCL